MKDLQQIINLLLGIIVLTIVTAIVNFGIDSNLALKRIYAKKQGVISCGYNQSIEGQTAFYFVNANDQYQRRCLNIAFKSKAGQSKNREQGTGCSHQLSVGALPSSFNRKQKNTCSA